MSKTCRHSRRRRTKTNRGVTPKAKKNVIIVASTRRLASEGHKYRVIIERERVRTLFLCGGSDGDGEENRIGRDREKEGGVCARVRTGNDAAAT